MSMAELKELMKKKGTDQIYREVREKILGSGIDELSKSALLGKMKVFLEGSAKTEFGKSNVRDQRGLHKVVKGVLGGLQKGDMMSVLLAPMKYVARATSKSEEAYNKGILETKFVEKGSEMFRTFNEPFFQFIQRLNAGSYLLRPVFNMYFLALPNIGKLQTL